MIETTVERELWRRKIKVQISKDYGFTHDIRNKKHPKRFSLDQLFCVGKERLPSWPKKEATIGATKAATRKARAGAISFVLARFLETLNQPVLTWFFTRLPLL